MHGLIFAELKKFSDERLGPDAWDELLAKAGLGGRMFLTIQSYSDADAVAIVKAACLRTGMGLDALLQHFGEFIAPNLLRSYAHLLDREWRTLDVLENTEQTIHRVVRLRNPGASPPELRTERPGPDHLIVVYGSARKMCGIAKGIVRGLARHFGETVAIDEPACMHSGAPQCRISVRRL
jgi:Haem-NO-binding